MHLGVEAREEQVGGRNIIFCTAGCLPWDAVSLGLVCLWIHCVCRAAGEEGREQKTKRGRDLRFNLRTRWRADTDVRIEK